MILGHTLQHEAERSYGDPFPIYVRPGEPTAGERFARHLRATRGVRIAVTRTTIPPSWSPHPDDLSKTQPGITLNERKWASFEFIEAFLTWKRTMHVGAALRH